MERGKEPRAERLYEKRIPTDGVLCKSKKLRGTVYRDSGYIPAAGGGVGMDSGVLSRKNRRSIEFYRVKRKGAPTVFLS